MAKNTDLTGQRCRAQSMSEWAREIGIKPGTLRNRIESGWSLEEALKKGKR